MIPRSLSLLASLVLIVAAGVLIFAGLTKLHDISLFEKAISSHGVFNGNQASRIAPCIALGEVLIGASSLYVLLASPQPARAAYFVALAFGIIAVYSWLLVADPPAGPAGCGCGFSRTAVIDWTPIALRNTGCFGLCFLASLPLRPRNRRPSDPGHRAGTAQGGSANAGRPIPESAAPGRYSPR